MRVILIPPDFPAICWSSRKALKFIARPGASPAPLGFLTLAAMLSPGAWPQRPVSHKYPGPCEPDLNYALGEQGGSAVF